MSKIFTSFSVTLPFITVSIKKCSQNSNLGFPISSLTRMIHIPVRQVFVPPVYQSKQENTTLPKLSRLQEHGRSGTGIKQVCTPYIDNKQNTCQIALLLKYSAGLTKWPKTGKFTIPFWHHLHVFSFRAAGVGMGRQRIIYPTSFGTQDSDSSTNLWLVHIVSNLESIHGLWRICVRAQVLQLSRYVYES